MYRSYCEFRTYDWLTFIKQQLVLLFILYSDNMVLRSTLSKKLMISFLTSAIRIKVLRFPTKPIFFILASLSGLW